MKITIDFWELVTIGIERIFKGSESEEKIIELLGEPEIYTLERKSYPTFMIYGCLEFRLRENKLETVVITFNEEELNLPNRMVIENIPERQMLKTDFIRKILVDKGVKWTLDSIMSDEYQENYISEKGVRFVFDLVESGVLSKIGIELNYKAK
ncbi:MULTISPECIES: hypothetical protein [Brevibacillus]|jgi:predicted transcriptional regulator YdeE|uniref:hypothetical protein n=1 Tax=Brevibacillus TaxID=55080 RepID=UPI001FAA32C8|nr:hypothetical protein [Brevibacillus borstelensis]MED1747184.1 hypothetical protein [Brevibacillus borstelensis]MED1855110.1 hypothetical protein [Brevibacillus borstelensis]MED1876960.1 hypothetical protein [Brevibacillus borstelensis]